tara:strand:+ start:233 stop:823 length:591 start_codon:yes stop_codon:yes gene_type:complete
MIDYGKMELFATPVYTAMIPDFDEYRNDIIDYARQYKSKYETVHVSNVGGYQSSSDIHQDPDFRSVCDRIWETVLLPGCDLMSDAFAERGFQGTKFSLHNLWFNSNPNGAWNMPHTHPHCFFSGVLWVKASEGSGELVLHSPHGHALYGLDHNVWGIPPEEGRVVLFPSNLQHNVNSNTTEDERISLSFNLSIDMP